MNVKKIEVIAKKEELEKIKDVVKDFVYSVDERGKDVKVEIYIHDEILEEILEKLENSIDLRRKNTIIEVYSPEFTISSALKRTEKKMEGVKEITPVEKLINETKPYTKLDLGKIALTSIAGIIALTGLFMNNIAIIIGAMLLSPMLGPIYSFAINTAVGSVKNSLKSILNLVILLVMVIIISFVVTILITPLNPSLTPEILSRFDATPIYILMALLLGFASIFSLTQGIPEGIAGVAIAAALLPPAVVSGISLYLYPMEFIKPLIMTFDNILGLMTGSLAATLFLKIGPRRYYEKVIARRYISRTTTVLVILLALLVFLQIF